MWRLMLVLALLLMLRPHPAQSSQSLHKNVCKSLEINTLEDFAKLRNCSIVVGHVRIAKLHFGTDWMQTALKEQVRSEVEEITDYLMIYRLYGLTTLEAIFPRLRIIRGRELLFDEYSLVIYENRDLLDLGLLQLMRIQAGSLRVESNPILCFAETVDWMVLLGNKTAQRFSVKGNKSPNHCPVCDNSEAEYSIREPQTKNCWNTHAEQLRFKPSRSNDCPKQCGLNGCDAAGRCCQKNCVTGCYASNCQLCGNYLQRSKCVDQCVTTFLLNKRECVTMSECRQMGYAIVGNECLAQCPDNHRPLRDGNGALHCNLNCTGHYVIKTAADLRVLTDCVIIRGSLTIQLHDIKEKIIAELEQALVFVKEITGYLKVLRSAPLMSLSFLRNLDTIRGDELLEQKYALYVVDNHHLEQIWDTNQHVAVFNGSIFFHLNPRLCYDKILALQPSLRTVQKISIADVSPNSNGERVICGSAVRSLNPTVEAINATAARIVVDLMSAEDVDILIGYSYHYKEAPNQNITMYDGRHGCGHDDWLMDVSPTKNRRHVISNLKPYTQYAFFVKTVTRTDYHMQIDAYSKILYFRTLPIKPTKVPKIYADSSASTEIMLHWWPPHRPNGIIDRYIVQYEAVNASINATVKYDDDSQCECKLVLPYYSGPLPDDEHYYNKDQLTYDEALPNLIYVSRLNTEPVNKQKFINVKDFNSLHTTTPATVTKETAEIHTTPSIVPANETKQNSDNKTISKTELEIMAERYQRYREQMEIKAIKIQDSGIKDFEIVPPPADCRKSSASNCLQPEQVEGTYVPGSQHYLLLENLLPEQAYHISVRACVLNVTIGCSNPTVVFAQTMNKRIEEFLEQSHHLF